MNKNGTSKLTAIILMAVAALGTVVAAMAVQMWLFPQSVNVSNGPLVSFTLNGQPWLNGTAVNWGTVLPGTTTNMTLGVHNGGNVNETLTLAIAAMPAGISEAWTLNGAQLLVGATLDGNLTLSIAVDCPPGNYASLPALAISVNP